jgi:hypothetical protein
LIVRDSRRSAVTLSLAILSGASCGSEAGQKTERAGDSTSRAEQSAAQRPTPGRYTLQDFARLCWIEGSWRGGLPDGGFFYERYGLLDDSTIVMHSLADSTLARATDSSRIGLRGGTVASESSTLWLATRLDSNAVDFALERDASNNFTWTRESPDRWTATLRSKNRQGREQVTIYHMQRIGR